MSDRYEGESIDPRSMDFLEYMLFSVAYETLLFENGIESSSL